MKDKTKIAHLGRPSHDETGPVNTPVTRASTILFPTYKDYKEGARYNDRTRKSAYGRMGTTIHRDLEETVCALEGGAETRLAPSGLNAVTTAMLAFLSAGDHVLVTDSAYDPTRKFCDSFLKRYGVETEYYDPLIGGDIEKLMRPETKVILTESPGSLTFEVQDLPAISKVADAHGAVVIVDNTWGAGYFLKPIALGAHVSVQAGTKYLSGHSDLLIGTITSATLEHADKVRAALRTLGTSVSADDAATTLRGVRTLGVRLENHEKAGLDMAAWLGARPEIQRLLHPALPDDPGYALWKRDFSGACGLFGAVFDANVSEQGYAAFFDALELFGIGFSWGGYESLALPTRPEIHRTATTWDPGGRTVRFHIGLEDLDDLKEDLTQAFAAMRAANEGAL